MEADATSVCQIYRPLPAVCHSESHIHVVTKAPDAGQSCVIAIKDDSILHELSGLAELAVQPLVG